MRFPAPNLPLKLSLLLLSFTATSCTLLPTPQPVVPPGTLTVTQTANGRPLTLHLDQTLAVQLNSTYWMFQPTTSPSVLISLGPAQVTSILSGCVPGEGCGTGTEVYQAIGLGQAQVSATRFSCGEALACTGNRRFFNIQVTVTK